METYQQYQNRIAQEKLLNYRKSEAQKGANAVRKGTDKFVKDYIEPIAKGAGSFTPLGPVIGLTDAYNAYKKGDTTSAIVGAGMEALPYAGKYITKGIKASVKPISKYISKDIPIFRKAPLILDEAGNIILSAPNNAKRNTTHFTWDIPVQSHRQGNWDGELTTIVTPWKSLSKSKVKSIEPSDIILEGNGISIPTKDISIITGSKTAPNNITRISSEKLENLMDNIIQARKSYINPPEIKIGGLNLSKPYDAGSPFFKEYSDEVMRLSKEHFKQPSLLQIKALEKSTGLKTGIIKSKANKELDNAFIQMSKGDTPKYPNGENIQFFKNGEVKYKNLHENMRNLFYHPASSIDDRLLKIKQRGTKIVF